MKEPQSFLPPNSQPWGRWVVSSLKTLIADSIRFRQETRNNLKQLNIALLNPMRGLVWTQNTFTVPIATQGVYVPMADGGNLDTDVSFNMEATLGPNLGGLKNVTDQTRTLVVVATYDGKGGNNQAIGLKLAQNGVPIDGTECRSFGGPSRQVGKTLTQWILKLGPGDELSMFVANIDGTTDLTIQRFKMFAHAIN